MVGCNGVVVGTYWVGILGRMRCDLSSDGMWNSHGVRLCKVAVESASESATEADTEEEAVTAEAAGMAARAAPAGYGMHEL